MLNTNNSSELDSQLQTIINKQLGLAHQILNYVSGDNQLDIAFRAKVPSLQPLIQESQNLKSIPNFSSKSEQNLALNDKDSFSRPVKFRISKNTKLIGDFVKINVEGRSEITGRYHRSEIKGVIINRTNGCVQNADWLTDTKIRGEPKNMRNRYSQDYLVVLLDVEDMCKLKNLDFGLQMHASKNSKFWKTFEHQNTLLNANKLHESWNLMIYIRSSIVQKLGPSAQLDNGLKNPYLHKYFKSYCVEQKRYIMNDLWASQHPQDHQKAVPNSKTRQRKKSGYSRYLRIPAWKYRVSKFTSDQVIT